PRTVRACRSFPTRRSSDLVGVPLILILKQPDLGTALVLMPMLAVGAFLAGLKWQHTAVFSLVGIFLIGAVFYPPVSRRILKPYQDRKSTRLNSSHVSNSYA